MKKVVTLTDVGLIAYPDSIQYETANNKPLKKLISFINKTQFDLIHILPFRPSDADKGFAVTDYTSVDSRFGSITDIKRCKKKIMIDFILNHTSIHHPWFTNFLKGKNNYYISFSKKPYSFESVYRPRNTPLFHQFHTQRGPEYVWTTFSKNQADLNWKNTQLRKEMTTILKSYCDIASIIRFDAVGYIWKKQKTSCFCLNHTVALYKDLKYICEKNQTLVVPEINNRLTYQKKFPSVLKYNFALPAILLHTIRTKNIQILAHFLSQHQTGFNVLSTHDGIPLEPARDYLSERQIRHICDGKVVSQTNIKSYEINSTWRSAVEDYELFLGTIKLLLFLQPIPLIYIDLLYESKNNSQFVEKRDIHRHHYYSEPKTYTFTMIEQLIPIRKQILGDSHITVHSKCLQVTRGEFMCFFNFGSEITIPLKTGVYRNIQTNNTFANKITLKQNECVWIKHEHLL